MTGITQDTEILTDEGIKPVSSCVGKSLKVLSNDGGWKAATIKPLGQGYVMEITLLRNNCTRTVSTAPDCNWLVRPTHTSYLHAASALQRGDRLGSMFGRTGPRVRVSTFGVAQGLVFGDGTRGETLNTAVRLVLCGPKNEELARFFPLSPAIPIPGTGVAICDLPRFWKNLPKIQECQSFLLGWLAGYFAADGCASTGGEYKLASAKMDHIIFARDVATRLGIACNEISTVSRLGLGEENTDLHSIGFVGKTLRKDFFLISEHRRRFERSSPRTPHPWFVQSTKPSKTPVDLFTVEVKNGTYFTIKDNIVLSTM